jgi:hypothetical protein
MQYQNKISKFNIAVILVDVKDSKLEEFLPMIAEIKDALKRVKKGQVIIVGGTESGS